MKCIKCGNRERISRRRVCINCSREEHRLYQRKYSKENRISVRKWRLSHLELAKKYSREGSRKARAKMRSEILLLLGNICSNPYNKPHPKWCNDPRILQIDHIDGGGTKELKSFTCRFNYYKFILEKIKKGSREYQLLCPNCNWLKRIEEKEVGRTIA